MKGKFLNLGNGLGDDGLEFVKSELLDFNGSVDSSQKVRQVSRFGFTSDLAFNNYLNGLDDLNNGSCIDHLIKFES